MTTVKDWFFDQLKQAAYSWAQSIGFSTLVFYGALILAGLWMANRLINKFSKLAPFMLGIGLLAATVAFYLQPPPPPPPPVVNTHLIDGEAVDKIGNGIKDAANAAGELAEQAAKAAAEAAEAAAKALADALPKPPTPEELAEQERIEAERRREEELAQAHADKFARIEAEKKRLADVKARKAARKQQEFAAEMQFYDWMGRLTQQQLYEAEMARQRDEAQFRALMQPGVIVQPPATHRRR